MSDSLVLIVLAAFGGSFIGGWVTWRAANNRIDSIPLLYFIVVGFASCYMLAWFVETRHWIPLLIGGSGLVGGLYMFVRYWRATR